VSEHSDFFTVFVVLALAGLVIWGTRQTRLGRLSQTLREGERGLVYRHGRFDREVGPGRHWMPFGRELVRVTMAEQTLLVPNQEVMTADRLPVKVTGLATYRITQARKAVEKASGGYQTSIYYAAQKAIRDCISEQPLETFVDARTKFDDDLKARAAPSFAEYGCELLTFTLRDVTLAPEVRRLATDVVRARMEAAASLERARGEQATLRSLANAARLVKGNPELMNLRILQALSPAPGKPAPTVILGTAPGLTPIPAAGGIAEPEPPGAGS